MTNLFLFLLLANIAFTQGSFAQQLTLDAEGCSVWLNGKPKPLINLVDSAVGKIQLKVYLVTKATGEHGVSISQFPFATEDAIEIENRIDVAIKTMISRTNVKKLSEKLIYLNGQKGKEVTVSKGKVFGKMKMFLVKYRLYQVISTGSLKYVNSALMTKFFDSFKLNEENIGEKWTTFTSKTLKFSVLFPTKPFINTIKWGSPDKNLFQHKFHVSSDNELFGVIVTDLSEDARMPKDDLSSFLTLLYGDQIVKNKQIVGGIEGIEALVELENSKQRIVSVVKNEKLYQIYFTGSDEKLKSQKIKSFFESFQFLD